MYTHIYIYTCECIYVLLSLIFLKSSGATFFWAKTSFASQKCIWFCAKWN